VRKGQGVKERKVMEPRVKPEERGSPTIMLFQMGVSLEPTSPMSLPGDHPYHHLNQQAQGESELE
jgi:hypothetical protein